MEIHSQVGQRIRYLRNLKNISQEKLALSAEINPSYLGHIERGLKSPTVTTLEKISKALEVSLQELFFLPNDSKIVNNAECTSVIERINLSIRNLSYDEMLHIANIVDEAVKLSKIK